MSDIHSATERKIPYDLRNW